VFVLFQWRGQKHTYKLYLYLLGTALVCYDIPTFCKVSLILRALRRRVWYASLAAACWSRCSGQPSRICLAAYNADNSGYGSHT
jgi:hypothetical protein